MPGPIPSTLSDEARATTATALQTTLVDLIDLSLVAKQAHWNLVGRQFHDVHLHLDELVDTARKYSDDVAERMAAIGVSPDGRAPVVAEKSAVPAFESGWVSDRDVIAKIFEAVDVVVRALRPRLDDTEKSDLVTQDLLIGIVGDLEEARWMWQAQNAGFEELTVGALDGRRVAILATDGVEEVELTQPRDAVTEAGATAEIISVDDGEIQAMNGDIEPAGRYRVDRRAADVSAADYDAVIMPGGTVNADRLRLDADVLRFVKDVFAAGKPVGAICHAPWTLVEAGVVQGRTLTSFPSLRTDIRNAGGNPVDEEVATDGALVTSRNPDDLPAFCAAIVKAFA